MNGMIYMAHISSITDNNSLVLEGPEKEMPLETSSDESPSLPLSLRIMQGVDDFFVVIHSSSSSSYINQSPGGIVSSSPLFLGPGVEAAAVWRM